MAPGGDLYRHSPLIYATTSRGQHHRSHFHQLGRQHTFDHPHYPISTLDPVSPYAVGSRSYRHKKKKKRHTSKSRTSSSKAHRSATHRDEEDFEDDNEDDDDDDDDDVVVSHAKDESVSGENIGETKRIVKHRKRRTETEKRKKKSTKSIDDGGSNGGVGRDTSKKVSETSGTGQEPELNTKDDTADEEEEEELEEEEAEESSTQSGIYVLIVD